MKKSLFLLISLIVATPALAQQQTELTFKFTAQETDVIWEALREQPVKKVETLMQRMRQQVMEQTQKPVEAPKEDKK